MDNSGKIIKIYKKTPDALSGKHGRTLKIDKGKMQRVLSASAVGKRSSQPGIKSKLESFKDKNIHKFLFNDGRYSFISKLGAGGMGTVYRAKDKMLDIEVAIKVLPASLKNDRVLTEEFKNEAKLAMSLSHENIVRLYHFDVKFDVLFFIMEYVDGKHLSQILSEMGPLSMETVLQIAYSCASALDYAHERGVIHRDLKPDNIMVNTDSILKIVDFGTARRGNILLRADNIFVEGTPAYTSPEQFQGHAPDSRMDVYSFGIIVHEILAGSSVYPWDISAEAVLETPPSPIPDHIPSAVADVIRKAYSMNPDDRWPSTGAFYQKLCEAVEFSGG